MGGFFGSISKSDCVSDIFYGTDYNSHLGTKRGGMVVQNGKGFTRSIHNIESSYFRTKFEPYLHEFKGRSGLGVISDTESQPIIISSHLGEFAIVTVAKIANIDELTQRALNNGRHFSETSDGETNPSELVASLITEEESIGKGIENVYDKVKGSCSLLILTDKGIYAARDKLGRTPVVLGKKEDGFAVSSESTSFSNLGYEVERDIGPGEILFITEDGYEQKKPPNKKMQICAFLWVYYGYPSSYYENINVEECRYRCGACLAKDDDIEVDFVSGIPDSGVAHAIGYSNKKQIPYKRAYVKYTPTWPRSFMPQSQVTRDLVAKMKLIPIKSLIKDKKIVFCDDSIVRGTQLKGNTKILFDYGAKEIHIRPACPTLIFPCEFLNFSRSRSTLDLAGRKAIQEINGEYTDKLNEYAKPGSDRYEDMIEKIRQRIGVTTLKYQKLDDLVEAIGLPKEQLCTHCWDGSSYF
ncbi:MAG: amidophosphoribosyltransferase [Bacteroidales bacterium]|nr:amidophosphoribosyltransferase [Bacteroidales bacterium]MCF8343402.1 amidophosphoribosyltransferase [Bacteroidales bacterium]MCF8349842.1 amidophosphoribosyltransferase [Bacteroidales bacterium]MCF8375562.1 amidophosphoribosyltransferase [Bacteroidales bacterium]